MNTPPSARRVAIITGGSSGIGRATALLFARRGWDVGLIARGAEALARVRQEIVDAGGACAVAAADVSDMAALQEAASAIEAALAPADAWVNGAGVGFYAPFGDLTEAEFRRVTEITYLGAVNGTRVALQGMRARDRGTIVNVGSAIAFRGMPLQSAYSGAKYALRGFTEAVRTELIHDRSRVQISIVHPPSTDTTFFSHAGSRMDGAPRPPPPVYPPDVVAEAIHRAATGRQREVLVTAQTVGIAALNTVAPDLADWALGRFGYAAQTRWMRERGAARADNLDAPSAGAGEAHAPDETDAPPSGGDLWAAKNRGALALGLGLMALAALAGPGGRRS